MDEQAQVIAINQGSVIVQSRVKSSCSQCQQVDNCGSGQVAKAFPQPKLTLEIETSETFNIGDNVIISIPEQQLLSVAWRVYLWPIIGLMLGASLGQYLTSTQFFSHEWPAMIMALSGGVIGFLMSRHQVNTSPRQQMLLPTIKHLLIDSHLID
ncbi:SoxR reducing system RseC family protein [Colwellia sp. MEBiC06753]